MKKRLLLVLSLVIGMSASSWALLADEEDPTLVLAEMVASANSLISMEVNANDYHNYPNYSKELRQSLQEAVEASEEAATDDEKTQAAAQLETLIAAVKECQQAYIYMVDQAESFLSYVDTNMKDALTTEQYDEVLAANDQVWTAFIEGSYSTEEALSLKDLKAVSCYGMVFGEEPSSTDGTYEMTEISHLVWAKRQIESGNNKLSLSLGADLDLSQMPGFMLATSADMPFSGTLDGQGHVIKLALNVPNTNNYSGAFIQYAQDVVVRNIHFTGTVTTSGKHCATVISFVSGNCLLESVTSDTDNYTNGADACLGGLIGMAGENGWVSIYTNVTFRHCAFTGSLTHTGNPSDHHGAPFVGWKGASMSEVHIENSYAAPSSVSEGTVQPFVRTWSGNDNGLVFVKNGYYLTTDALAWADVQGEPLTQEQFENGEACYLLNGGSTFQCAWFQTIGEDKYPVLDNQRGIVFCDNGTYFNQSGDDGIIYSAEQMLASKPDCSAYEQYPGYSQELRQGLEAAIAVAKGAGNAAEKEQAIAALTDLMNSIKECQAAYVQMMKKMEEDYGFITVTLGADLDASILSETEELRNSICNGFVEGAYSMEEAAAISGLSALSCYQQLFGVEPSLADGFYQCSKAEHLVWIAKQVNAGNNKLNVLLTDDIDMSELPLCQPIGRTDNPAYEGFFEGQNHTISGWHITTKSMHQGFIGSTHFTTVQNFTIEGEMTCCSGTSQSGGAIGDCWDCTFNNIHSRIDITIQDADVTMVGGTIGWVMSAGTTVKNCSFSGTLNAGDVDGYFGGVVGYNAGSLIQDCANYGELTTSSPTCFLGGITGVIDNGGVRMYRCLNAGQVTCSAADPNTLTGGITGYVGSYSETNIADNYWVDGTAEKACGGNTVSGFKQIDMDKCASGALCWTLNKGVYSNPVWRQNVGDDPMPVLDAQHGIVFALGEEYLCLQDEASIESACERIMEYENDYADEIRACKSLVERHKELVGALATCKTVEAFAQVYDKVKESHETVQVNADAYTALEEMAVRIEKDTEGSTSMAADVLLAYLTEYSEPDDAFVNGSYLYIMEALILDTEALQGEMAFMEELYKNVVADEMPVGSDVTVMLSNPDFSQGFEGWNAQGGGTDPSKPIAECWNGTGEWTQTLTGLRNGVYEVVMSAGSRTNDNDEAKTYSAYLFANENQVPVMLYHEDALPKEDAVDNENCYIENSPIWPYDRIYQDNAYTPSSTTGATIAYNSGRYVNRILVEVTDGTLTLGIRMPGSGMAGDWLSFAKTKMVYWGPKENANEGMDHVLEGMAARARTMLEYEYSSGADCALYPNFSQELRDQLAAAVEAASSVADASEKYELISNFSKLFLAVREGQLAYVGMLRKAEAFIDGITSMRDAGILASEEYLRMYEDASKFIDIYCDGSYTTEQAQNIRIIEGEMDGDTYVIRNQQDMLTYAIAASSFDNASTARLESDIDLSGMPTLMIGTNRNMPFMGTIDGQGHTINLALHVENTENYSGAFIQYATNATIKNLNFTGTVTTYGKHCATVISFAWGNCLLENVTSSTDNYTSAGDACLAGLVGMAGENGWVSDYTNVTFRNCAFTGSLTHTGNPADHHGAPFVGWKGAIMSEVNIENSYAAPSSVSAGTVQSFVRTWSGVDNGLVRVTNSFCLKTDAYSWAEVQGSELTQEQFENGEACYLLNGDQSTISWYQNLGEDAYPVLDATHATIIKSEDGGYAGSTAIEAIDADRPVSGDIYDLNGRKVQSVNRKGIYIQNGKKVFIK